MRRAIEQSRATRSAYKRFEAVFTTNGYFVVDRLTHRTVSDPMELWVHAADLADKLNAWYRDPDRDTIGAHCEGDLMEALARMGQE